MKRLIAWLAIGILVSGNITLGNFIYRQNSRIKYFDNQLNSLRKSLSETEEKLSNAEQALEDANSPETEPTNGFPNFPKIPKISKNYQHSVDFDENYWELQSLKNEFHSYKSQQERERQEQQRLESLDKFLIDP